MPDSRLIKTPVAVLVLRARDGDLDAFDQLVRRYQDMAAGYARSVLGDFDLAEDAAQEAFIQAHRDLKDLRDPAKFAGWLRTIVFKYCDRILRARDRKTVPLDLLAGQPSTAISPHEFAMRQQTREIVSDAIQALPEHERTATVLYYIGEYSHKEIADFLDVTANAVKTRLYSARQRLKERMVALVEDNLTAQAPSKSDRVANAVRMVTACKAGDTNTVAALLAADPELARMTSEIGRFEPLHYAARGGHTEIVRLLLAAGADPAPFEHMLRNHMGSTTLEIARMRGFTEIVRMMEAKLAERYQASPGADDMIRAAIKISDLDQIRELVMADPGAVHATDDDGNTPLHRAAEKSNGATDLIDFLLGQGAKIDATNALGFKPVDLTLWRNHQWTGPSKPRQDMMRHFLRRGAEYNINLACAAGDLERVRELLAGDKGRANFTDTFCRRPLSVAAEFGHLEAVRLLLENGADPNSREAGDIFISYPLYAAAQRNDTAMGRLLLSYGCSANAEVNAGGNALSQALDHGNTELAELIESHGGKVFPDYYPWKGNVEKVREILEADPSRAQDMVALANEDLPIERSTAILDLGFAHGADPKQVGNWPLYRAITNPPLLECYLKHGVDPNISDKEGKTTLHSVGRWPNVESARILLRYGADINARDAVFQSTPLAWAAMFGRLEVVEFLLANGANANLPDDEPWATPLFWAEHKGHSEVADLLRRHGAK